MPYSNQQSPSPTSPSPPSPSPTSPPPSPTSPPPSPTSDRDTLMSGARDIINRMRKLAPEERMWLQKNLDEQPEFANVFLKMFPELVPIVQQQQQLGQAPANVGQIPPGQPSPQSMPPLQPSPQSMPQTKYGSAPGPGSGPQNSIPGGTPQQNPLSGIR